MVAVEARRGNTERRWSWFFRADSTTTKEETKEEGEEEEEEEEEQANIKSNNPHLTGGK